jgi:hypothetical protein
MDSPAPQASSRIPATLAIAFEPTGPGFPAVVNAYYEKKAEPFIMARQQEQGRKTADALIAWAMIPAEEPAEEILCA